MQIFCIRNNINSHISTMRGQKYGKLKNIAWAPTVKGVGIGKILRQVFDIFVISPIEWKEHLIVKKLGKICGGGILNQKIIWSWGLKVNRIGVCVGVGLSNCFIVIGSVLCALRLINRRQLYNSRLSSPLFGRYDRSSVFHQSGDRTVYHLRGRMGLNFFEPKRQPSVLD